MARMSGLVGVVADLVTCLMAVDGFDGRIHIHNPWLTQPRQPSLVQRLGLSVGTGLGLGLGRSNGAADAVFAKDLPHPQAGRVDRVGTQRRDMAVVMLAGEHRQRDEAQQIVQCRRVVTAELGRTVLDPVAE